MFLGWCCSTLRQHTSEKRATVYSCNSDKQCLLNCMCQRCVSTHGLLSFRYHFFLLRSRVWDAVRAGIGVSCSPQCSSKGPSTLVTEHRTEQGCVRCSVRSSPYRTSQRPVSHDTVSSKCFQFVTGAREVSLQLAAASYIYMHYALKIRKKQRRWWQTQLYTNREVYSGSSLLRDLSFQSACGLYKNFTRMSTTEFEFLITLMLGSHIIGLFLYSSINCIGVSWLHSILTPLFTTV